MTKPLLTALLFGLAFTMFPGDPAAYAKRADLAGMWYPAGARELRSEVEGYINSAGTIALPGRVIGVIAPHAGIRYSGEIAGYAYSAVRALDPDLVVIVGFSHRRYLPGKVAVFTGESFDTPLGPLAVDREATEKIMKASPRMIDAPDIFSGENSIELQLPFVQAAAPRARAVIIAMTDQGEENSKALADALYGALKSRKSFVMVASTDMCHYRPYESAKETDARTIAAIRTFKPEVFYRASLSMDHELMCGYGAVYAVMDASGKLGADKFELLKYANSGDTSGMKDKVVGYMSGVFVNSAGPDMTCPAPVEGGKEMLSKDEKLRLLKLARETIKTYLETGKRFTPPPETGTLKEDMGAFVTLHKRGELRGCIGHMVASEPLYLTVRDMAIAAATEDPRFPRVTLKELDDIDIEISALSPMKRVASAEEITIPGDGVLVRMGMRSGVYLPQVATETGWTKEEFMNSLCAHKAGLPMNAWKTGACEMYVYTAEVFGEKELGVK